MKSLWFTTEDGWIWFETFELKTHECTAAELGLTDSDDSRFWPVNKSNRIQIIPEMYYCLDPSDLELQGN